MGRVAVIDLGTNTFHLLITEQAIDGAINELFRHKEFVQLAEDGIEMIGNDAMERAVNTVRFFKQKLQEYEVLVYKAVGTAALRKASNGAELASEITDILESEIDIISGEREADLIYKGTKLIIPFDQSKDLIMDIGGGSVEFIICDAESKIWQESFEIGVAVLFRMYHKNDPITEKEIDDIEKHLQFVLSPLLDRCRNFQINHLIGASGSFEVMEQMLGVFGNMGKYTQVDLDSFSELAHRIIEANFDERLHMPGLPESRAKLIVVAMILIRFICRKVNPAHILVSPYALKEGLISELNF